ncbi:hypothetical protein LUZ61_017015 [Rhynchospora tenuis]|uniref:KIB1-4 beta-propeller domain-containing protein n=1 Tax=Rhynchospora tenuis TaxID=198213 RepID=A0AAD5Z6M7_9POAL|nr:hypothetical protein LUZ61_017015 [Rhynchospora tenuis]
MSEKGKSALNMEGEGSPSGVPDWAHLPLAAMKLVSEKVKSINDYVRFRAVCSPWRSASLPKPRHLPPQLPWLMIPYDAFSTYKKDDGIRLFYDLWESKMRRLHLPETIGIQCIAADRGWLLLVDTEDYEEVFLLNPLTRARIILPPLATPVNHLRNNLSGDFAISKVTFSAALTDPNCMITVFLAGCKSILYCWVKHPCWTTVANSPNSFGKFSDATCYNGRFYLLYERALVIIDSRKPMNRITYALKPEWYAVSKFFLEGKSGVYVLLAFFSKGKFELYQFQEQPMMFTQITNLTNTAIFDGDNNYYLAVSSDDRELFVGGPMYICTSVPSAVKHEVVLRYNIYCVKRDEGMVEPVVCDLGEAPLDSPIPAMWFQPSFV